MLTTAATATTIISAYTAAYTRVINNQELLLRSSDWVAAFLLTAVSSFPTKKGMDTHRADAPTYTAKHGIEVMQLLLLWRHSVLYC